LKEGETTALNTQEYVFFGYYQRIRERLDRAWTGLLREQLVRIFKMGRQLASEQEHVTRLLVTMNAGGEVVRIRVIEASGTQDLDEAAIRAFNQAGPFPNPPSGMTDSLGQVEIRWDFVLRT
jgi:protein TonB